MKKEAVLVNLYNLLNIIIFPLYLIVLAYRFIAKKENSYSIRGRLSIMLKPRREGKLIWLHAASVGESVVAINLSQVIRIIYPEINFLITTGTLSAATILEKSSLHNTDHQFAPIDNIFAVKIFLQHYKPDLGIFIESEIWPYLIIQSSKICKLLLVNGRLSDKSFNAWIKRRALFNYIVSHFSRILLQSEKDLSKYLSLGFPSAVNLGNIKFSNKKLTVNIEKLEILQKIVRDKKIFVAASTHKEDEDIILKMIQKFKTKQINYYPIVILRHPSRRDDIAKECQKMNLTFSFSQNAMPNMQDDLYIVDSFGELGLFYTIAMITFIGGSFAQLGGHNLIESAFFNNVIILGPDMSNFQNISDEMIAKQAAIQVMNQSDLEEQVEFFLQDSSAMTSHKMAKNAMEYVTDRESILEKYISEIRQFI
jgi:3-deoxy-D-manno-octulosonic-acid transferase